MVTTTSSDPVALWKVKFDDGETPVSIAYGATGIRCVLEVDGSEPELVRQGSAVSGVSVESFAVSSVDDISQVLSVQLRNLDAVARSVRFGIFLDSAGDGSWDDLAIFTSGVRVGLFHGRRWFYFWVGGSGGPLAAPLTPISSRWIGRARDLGLRDALVNSSMAEVCGVDGAMALGWEMRLLARSAEAVRVGFLALGRTGVADRGCAGGGMGVVPPSNEIFKERVVGIVVSVGVALMVAMAALVCVFATLTFVARPGGARAAVSVGPAPWVWGDYASPAPVGVPPVQALAGPGVVCPQADLGA